MQRQQGMRTGTAKAKRAIFFYPIKKVYEELKKKKKDGVPAGSVRRAHDSYLRVMSASPTPGVEIT